MQENKDPIFRHLGSDNFYARASSPVIYRSVIKLRKYRVTETLYPQSLRIMQNPRVAVIVRPGVTLAINLTDAKL